MKTLAISNRLITALFLGLLGAAGSAAAQPKALPKAFTLQGLTGGVTKRADLRGKVVVMQFFASWCKGCGEVMGLINPIVGSGATVRFLPVSVDESMAEAKGYFKIQRPEIKPIERLAALDKDAKLASSLGVEALPAIVVVDGEGLVLQAFSGHPSDEQLARLKSLLPK